MSRQITISALVAATLVSATIAGAQYSAQNYVQLGMMSGSGLVYMPSSANAPAAQFRLQLGRIGMTKGGQGLNLINVSAGFSPFLEGYLKFTSEQVGSVQSVGTIGLGAKFTLPVILPVVKTVSLWGESSTSPNLDKSELYSPALTRGALIVTPVSNGISPSVLVGATKDPQGSFEAMQGASLVVNAGHSVQMGIEYMHGYNGPKTHHAALSGVIRPFPYVSVNIGPGYLSTPALSGWTWSLGISLNTSDVDFKPVEVQRKNGYKLPTIEEMEKEPAGNQSDKQSDTDEGKNNE